MKKLALLGVAFAALIVATAGLAAPRATGPGKPTLTMNFLEVQTSSGVSIPESQRPSAGDRLWFHSEFYKWHNAKRGAHLGHADATGVFLGMNGLQVTGVASLPGGTVTVVGMSGGSRVTRLAVVGGTGSYATARGEVIIRALGKGDESNSADTLRLWL